MKQKEIVQIVVTQDSSFLRTTLIERLEQEPWIQVCAVASEIDETRALIELHQPQVLVINVSLKCSAGVTSLKQMRRIYPELAIVAISCDSDEDENQHVEQALRAEADGYVSSEDSPKSLVQAIWTVRAGSGFINQRAEFQYQAYAVDEEMLAELSRREAEVFCLTGCGYVPRRIADMMNLSVKTIESYRERIRKKMNLNSGADLLYASTSFMREAARRGVKGSDDTVVKELLSATR